MPFLASTYGSRQSHGQDPLSLSALLLPQLAAGAGDNAERASGATVVTHIAEHSFFIPACRGVDRSQRCRPLPHPQLICAAVSSGSSPTLWRAMTSHAGAHRGDSSNGLSIKDRLRAWDRATESRHDTVVSSFESSVPSLDGTVSRDSSSDDCRQDADTMPYSGSDGRDERLRGATGTIVVVAGADDDTREPSKPSTVVRTYAGATNITLKKVDIDAVERTRVIIPTAEPAYRKISLRKSGFGLQTTRQVECDGSTDVSSTDDVVSVITAASCELAPAVYAGKSSVLRRTDSSTGTASSYTASSSVSTQTTVAASTTSGTGIKLNRIDIEAVERHQNVPHPKAPMYRNFSLRKVTDREECGPPSADTSLAASPDDDGSVVSSGPGRVFKCGVPQSGAKKGVVGMNGMETIGAVVRPRQGPSWRPARLHSLAALDADRTPTGVRSKTPDSAAGYRSSVVRRPPYTKLPSSSSLSTSVVTESKSNVDPVASNDARKKDMPAVRREIRDCVAPVVSTAPALKTSTAPSSVSASSAIPSYARVKLRRVDSGLAKAEMDRSRTATRDGDEEPCKVRCSITSMPVSSPPSYARLSLRRSGVSVKPPDVDTRSANSAVDGPRKVKCTETPKIASPEPSYARLSLRSVDISSGQDYDDGAEASLPATPSMPIKDMVQLKRVDIEVVEAKLKTAHLQTVPPEPGTFLPLDTVQLKRTEDREKEEEAILKAQTSESRKMPLYRRENLRKVARE